MVQEIPAPSMFHQLDPQKISLWAAVSCLLAMAGVWCISIPLVELLIFHFNHQTKAAATSLRVQEGNITRSGSSPLSSAV